MSSHNTRSRSVNHRFFEPVTIEERIEKTTTLLNAFLDLTRLNHSFDKKDEVTRIMKVKGKTDGNGFFQILLSDLVELGKAHAGWKTVFTQNGFGVTTLCNLVTEIITPRQLIVDAEVMKDLINEKISTVRLSARFPHGDKDLDTKLEYLDVKRINFIFHKT